MADVDLVVEAWEPYIQSIDNWETLVKGVTPKDTTCGPAYELPNPIDRPNESFAIADMRDIAFAEPHYHINDETEIHFVLEGLGFTVVGGKERYVKKGDVIVTPPDTSHFTVPDKNLVIAVVNTPPFNHLNVVVNKHTDPRVGFDQEQFERFTRVRAR